MRKLAVPLALVLVLAAAPLAAQDDDGSFSPDQLDNLLAPIALYPDPLLAQVLVAATFPDDVDEADRVVRGNASAEEIDEESWDVSVKAVAHYPEVIQMMSDKLDWTTALGQAYASQPADVMAAVQRLRAQAKREGNLVSTSEMQVASTGSDIEIWPAQPEYIYVPSYDPALVYSRRAPLFFPRRFAIGAWLNRDFDWRGHRVYYHGWEHGPGWVSRSRAFIRPGGAYVNDRFRTVFFNRDVIRHQVDYRNLNRYGDVHRRATFDTFRGFGRRPGALPIPPAPPGLEALHNKVFGRNINTRDARLNEFRGRAPRGPAAIHPPEPSAFGPPRGGFDAREASRRGQASRMSMAPPRPPAPPRFAPPAPRPPARRDERRHK